MERRRCYVSPDFASAGGLASRDQIVVLKDGRVEAIGTLDQLLPVSGELQRLWYGEETSELAAEPQNVA
jgi:ABC-type molybdate transport system ATPase subunit